MDAWVPLVGAAAAILTSLSYLPQVKKAWPRGATKDLSFGTLIALTSGLLLWACYGAARGDWTIVAANLVAAALSGCVLVFKIRDTREQAS